MPASGQIWVVSSLGGYLSNKAFSEKIRVTAQPQMLFRTHVDDQPEKGEVAGGDTVLFNKIRNVTTAGASLNETTTIPKTEFLIVQDSIVIKEFGNSVPFTEKLDVISKISVPELTTIALTNDMAKTLDSQAAIQFTATEYKAVCETTASTVITTNGTGGTTAVANPSDKNIRDIVDDMKKKNVPKLNGEYRAIFSTNAIRGVYDFFEAKANFTTLGIATNGLVGKYYGLTFMEETNFLSNTIGTGSVFGEGVIFGSDAVREKIVTPEEIRIKIPSDYGRDRGIAWYYMGNFKVTWNFTNDAEAHIVHITTA